jgi:hypothetical protein
MGWFSSKPQKQTMRVVPLRRGTRIPIVNVEQAFIDEARVETAPMPRQGHVVPVHVGLAGKEIAVYYKGKRVAVMDPGAVDLYIDEFKRLSSLGIIGSTDAHITPVKLKSPHSINLNWGVRAHDGGVIPDIKVSL